MLMVGNKIEDDKEMYLRCSPFRWPHRYTGAMRCALPNAACPGLLRKHMVAAIRRCRKLPRCVPYKGTSVPYDGTFGVPDQGQMLDV